MKKEYLKIGEAAYRSGLSPKTLRKLLDRGYIRGGHSPGGHRLFQWDSVKNYIEREEQEDIDFLRRLRL